MFYARIILIAGVGLWLSLAAPINAAAQNARDNRQAQPGTVTASGNCAPTATKYTVATGTVHTTSTDYVNLSGTTINFVQGGTKESCVIVSFSASVQAPGADSMLVRATLNGLSCQPHDNEFIKSNTSTFTGFEDRAVNIVCSAAPGSNSVKMQYRSGGGGSVGVDTRTMIVHYVP